MLPFILGLIHRRLKKLILFSVIYITLSWVIITTILPAYLSGTLNSVYWFSIIVGLQLFCNAYMSSLREYAENLYNVHIIQLLSVITIVIVLFLGNRYLSLLPLAVITTLVLYKYRKSEYYELFYLDGFQLLGVITAILLLGYVL